MSDEFDPIAEPVFSSFWPLLIVISGLLIWFAVQDYQLNRQCAALNAQFQQAVPSINEAQNINTRYVALMKDLVNTAQKDEAAKAIVNDAIKAGLIQVKPGATNGAASAPQSK